MMSIKALLLISALVVLANGQASKSGNLDKNIYQFLKSNQATSKFIELLERTSQQAQDMTVVNALGANSGNRVLPTDNSGQTGRFTVFAPMNDALNQVPQDVETLRNDFSNLVLKEMITLETLKAQKDGKNITSALTFGFRPRLSLRMVANFYNRQLDQSTTVTNNRRKRQLNINNRFKRQFNNNQFNNNNQNNQFNNNNQNNQFNNNNNNNNQFNNNNQNNQFNNGMNMSDSNTNLYEQYEALYGQRPAYNGPPISPKLPQDELYLLNNAIILDKFECSNGIVYLIDAYPQYYDKTLYSMAKENTVNGFGQNINNWINRADQSFNRGNENLRNALQAYGANTFFLPTDGSFTKFTDRQLLNNDSFLIDVVLKGHRISNQVLFDYYLDNPQVTYMTDGQLPVSTRHRYINNKVEIEVSIGHVKGKILPEFRNIYCASGVIHLIDTILGVPSESAYKKISNNPQLNSFKQLIDASSSYRQTLDRSPISTNPSQSSSVKQMTILAPNEIALLAIKDDLLKNTTALEDFLSTHIIVDGSNKVFFTDHDQSIFTSGRTYQTMNPEQSLVATVSDDPDGVSKNVVLALQNDPSIKATIIDGNDLVSNGVIHIVDRPLSAFTTTDITVLLERYSSISGPGQPAFNQFVDALRSTGIFNDLKEPSKQYTLFIPTNQALAQYQDIMNGNDQDKKRQLIYRHICIDQNLQSKNLANPNGNTNQPINNQPQEGQLICRNALGQDLTLSKDEYGLISKWQGMASSKVINDFPGVYSSAYLLDETLLNPNVPNLGLHGSSSILKPSLTIMFGLILLVKLF